MYDLLQFSIFLISMLTAGVTVLLILYYSSGWFRLRKFYSTARKEPAGVRSFQSAQICSPYNFDGFFGPFRNCLKIGYSESGLYVTEMFPFNYIFRPVEVPWEDLFLSRFELNKIAVSKVPEFTVVLSAKMFDVLLGSGFSRNTDTMI